MPKLYSYQEEAIQFLIERERALLASDAGTGKTIVALKAIEKLVEEGLLATKFITQQSEDNSPQPINLQQPINQPSNAPALTEDILVLCPKSLILNWKREIYKWVPHLTSRIYVINYDKLVSDKFRHLLLKPWSVVILDESHTAIKNPRIVRSTFIMQQMLPLCHYVWLMTATPASTKGSDYYCTLKIIEPERMSRYTFSKFEKEFCKKIPDRFSYSGFKYDGFNNQKLLKVLFSRNMRKDRKVDVLSELPDKVYTLLPLELDKRETAKLLEVDTEEVLRCIDNNLPIPGHVQSVLQAVALSKIRYVLEWLESYPEGESVVFFGWHRHVVEELAERLGCPFIHGGVSAASRDKIVQDFQNGVIRRVVLNMQSGGVGITLTRANTACYVEFPYTPTHLIQSEDRVHRIGSVGLEGKIHIVRFLAVGSVDEKVYKRLDERVRSIQEVGV